ncbi:hemerythrin domain-containing protein [Sorangium sp. So ce131]|uniref:hemerythrin domain-containing protein n=1 Tax=Sorangium sp. So ce131 TaxID=3133282 RepID=UPI003F61E24A
MKATDLLKEQHQEVDELFERISRAGGNDIRALRDELVTRLVGHSAIEEEIFYPETREALGASPLIPTSYEEHSLVHIMLQKLLSAEPGDETFHARLGVLKELVQHHVEEEERELFPQVERAMGAERLEQLGTRLESRFDQVREGKVEQILSQAVARSMPAARGRAQAQKPAARKAAAAKRPAAKRATTQRAEPARGAQKGRRGAAAGRGGAAAGRGGAAAGRGGAAAGRGGAAAGRGGAAAGGRKKAAEAAPAKTGRAAPARKTSRPAPASTGRTGRKGGRTSNASTR